MIAHMARKGVMQKTKGHYPAPLAVLPLVVRAPRVSIEDGVRDVWEKAKLCWGAER